MDENKVIRPMDFVRLTNIDELNVIKDTKNHIGLVKEVSRDGSMSVIWIGDTYSRVALPVEPAYMGRRSGKTRRSPCPLAWLSNKITYKYVRKYEY